MDYKLILFCFLAFISISFGTETRNPSQSSDPVDNLIERIKEPGFFSPLTTEYVSVEQQDVEKKTEKTDGNIKELKESLKEIQQRNSKIIQLMQEITILKTESTNSVEIFLEKVYLTNLYNELNIESLKRLDSKMESMFSSDSVYGSNSESNYDFDSIKLLIEASIEDLQSIHELVDQYYINVRNSYIDSRELSEIMPLINEFKKYFDVEIKLAKKTSSFYTLIDDIINNRLI